MTSVIIEAVIPPRKVIISASLPPRRAVAAPPVRAGPADAKEFPAPLPDASSAFILGGA
jgi:hypothetical protein